MNRFVQFSLILLIGFSMQSCHRKAVHKKYPYFIGHWYHRDTNGESWNIDIDDKSWGTITVYDSDGDFSSKHKYGENPRRWRYNEEKQELTNGIISSKFKVDQLPGIAETPIINGHDTIQAGRTYCIINGNYYLKSH